MKNVSLKDMRKRCRYENFKIEITKMVMRLETNNSYINRCFEMDKKSVDKCITKAPGLQIFTVYKNCTSKPCTLSYCIDHSLCNRKHRVKGKHFIYLRQTELHSKVH